MVIAYFNQIGRLVIGDFSGDVKRRFVDVFVNDCSVLLFDNDAVVVFHADVFPDAYIQKKIGKFTPELIDAAF